MIQNDLAAAIRCAAYALILLPMVNLSMASDTHADHKPRVIVTTDGEGDDQCSMVRFLLYASEWDIKGLIHTSSKHHWKGNADQPGKKWLGTAWLDDQIDRYAEAYPNLKQHADFPSPAYLRQQVFEGNVELEGDVERATPGSNRIAEVLLDPDPSPVWLQAWGGPNTIARALMTIEESHPDQVDRVARKVRIFMVANQDPTWDNYISKQWPGVMTLQSRQTYGAIAYRWRDLMSDEVQSYFSVAWLAEHILNDHGSLCASYLTRKDGSFRSEGDSPAFMHLIDVGLRNNENPGYGGWGGRFTEQPSRWVSTPDDGDIHKPILRWAIDFQNDWAARADWCVTRFEDANHPPTVVLGHDADLTGSAGETIRLEAGESTDPDGNELTFKWWSYPDAGTYPLDTAWEADGPEASFTIPKDAREGETIHLLCQVTDDGVPPITRYARVIVEIAAP